MGKRTSSSDALSAAFLATVKEFRALDAERPDQHWDTLAEQAEVAGLLLAGNTGWGALEDGFNPTDIGQAASALLPLVFDDLRLGKDADAKRRVTLAWLLICEAHFCGLWGRSAPHFDEVNELAKRARAAADHLFRDAA